MQEIIFHFKETDLIVKVNEVIYDEESINWFLKHGKQMEDFEGYVINKPNVISFEIINLNAST